MEALLIFCEGKCDVAFLNLVLKYALPNCHEESKKTCEYPSPFGEANLSTLKYINSFDEENAQELMISKHLYRYNNENNLKYIVTYDLGGQEPKKSTLDFLNYTFDFFHGVATVFRQNSEKIDKTKYLFIFDKDYLTLDERIKKWKKDFNQENANWQIAGNQTLVNDGCIVEDKALFIFEMPNKRFSSLEDILIDIANKNPSYQELNSIHTFIVQRWYNSCSNSNETDLKSLSKEYINKNKIVLTIAGQYHKPGLDLGAIIDYLIKENGNRNKQCQPAINALLNNQSVQNLIGLITQMLND